jgi:endonuclease-3 related protein
MSPIDSAENQLMRVYRLLQNMYGPSDWWPAETPFEVMVGAFLTQNTGWHRVEIALANLRPHGIHPERILELDSNLLEAYLKPTGYFRTKAQRLRDYCHWYLAQGGHEALQKKSTKALREALLARPGIGSETADSILVYAFQREVFVIDTFTKRLCMRLGIVDGTVSYQRLQTLFEQQIPKDATLYNQYHALIVIHAKERCLKRNPICSDCLLRPFCLKATEMHLGER